MYKYIFFVFVFSFQIVIAQNPLQIPVSLTGTTFNLTVQSGTQNFYTGISTPTYGINGTFLAPTIIVNKGDSITLNVLNNLNVRTTLHWHGLHVAAKDDGGPHQSIAPGQTWSPSFKIRNNASTYWYHPHGEGQTDIQVCKGIAGFFIVHDAVENALAIPQTYNVDDFPIVIQTKEFDVLKQIAIAGGMDTAIFINGTLDPYLNVPAQVIRLRLLNGSSQRAYQLGLSNNQNFSVIATDGGLLSAPFNTNRIQIAPGERYDILLNLSALSGGSFYLKNYGSELPKGIYGADSVGNSTEFPHEYYDNPLNGADYNLLKLNIVAPTASAINTIPSSLAVITPINIASAVTQRNFVFDTIRLLAADKPSLAAGPFGINNKSFNMDTINEIVYLNTAEIWSLKNKTLIAHPFHVHDVQFNIIEKSGVAIPVNQQNWKDVVLVMPNDSVKFITKFEDFADDNIPYMYHCHLLHHEDDGMMGSFVVRKYPLGVKNVNSTEKISIAPNPSNTYWKVYSADQQKILSYELFNVLGQSVLKQNLNETSFIIGNEKMQSGLYILKVHTSGETHSFQVIKN